MLEAVKVVHDAGIVHTDLKPANFVLVKGALKLIDFGIAKAIPSDTTNIARDQQVSCAAYSFVTQLDGRTDRHRQLHVAGSALRLWHGPSWRADDEGALASAAGEESSD